MYMKGERETITENGTGLPAGTYYIKIKRGLSRSLALYHFTVNYTASDCYEKELNESFNMANDIQVNKEYIGNIRSINEAGDFYRFTLDNPGYVRFSFSHEYVDTNNNC